MFELLTLGCENIIYEIEQNLFLNYWDLNSIQYYIEKNKVLSYKIDKKIVAYLIFDIIIDEVEIFRIGVLPEFQNQGIGKLLINQIKKINGIKKIILEVSSKNSKALVFYKNLNFNVVGIRKNYYGIGNDAYLMDLVL